MSSGYQPRGDGPLGSPPSGVGSGSGRIDEQTRWAREAALRLAVASGNPVGFCKIFEHYLLTGELPK